MMRYLFLLAAVLCGGALLLPGSLALAAEAKDGAISTVGIMVQERTSLTAWLVVAPVLLPLLGSGILVALRSALKLQAPIALVIMGLTALCAVGLNAEVAASGPQTMALGNWLAPFGIVLAVDALGGIFVLVTSIVGLVGLGYARHDTDEPSVRYGFYSFYLLLISGVNGAFSTGDIFNLYVWFEVFLIASFGLIVLGGERRQMDGAVKYGVLNLIATTIFLIAVGAIYGVTGTLNMADIRGALAGAQVAPVITIGALFTLAFAMKAAAFPLHFWLPASYHTPKIIVAAIFAGLLTKVGVYSLLRVMVMLYGSDGDLFLPILAAIGVVTAILGAVGALAQTELRRIGSFLVVSGIGVMLIGIGIGSVEGYAGAIVYAVHSIIVMTAFFLILGLVERLSGAMTLRGGANLYSTQGFAASLFLVFGFAAAGLPPFSGFWPKFMLIDASLGAGGTIAVMGTVGIILSGFLTTIVIGRSWALVFLRPGDGEQTEPTPPSVRALTIPVAVFAALVIGLGVFPSVVIEPAEMAAQGLIDPSAYVEAVLGADGGPEPATDTTPTVQEDARVDNPD